MSLLNFISAQTIESINDTVAVMGNEVSAAAASAEPLELSVWELCMKGGFIMIPLAILLLISIYIFIERYIVISRADKQDASFMKRIKDYIHEGEIESAKIFARKPIRHIAVLFLKAFHV